MKRKYKVEASEHTDHYIKLRKNGMSLPDLEKEARRMGEAISHQAFYRYFKYKKKVDIEGRLKRLVDENDMGVIRDHNESINVIDEVKRNLRTLQGLTAAMIQSNPSNPQAVNACTNLLKESRMSLQYLDKKRKDMMLESETSEEMGIATLLELLNQIPSKCPKCSTDLDIVNKLEKKLKK